MAKILLIEDDLEFCNNIKIWLVAESHTLETANNGIEGLERLRFYPFDLAIIDWQLPGLAGIEVCRQFRAAGGKTPVLILTGKDSVVDKVAGLDSGADDYLTKPFHPTELSARLRALLRRPGEVLANVLRFGPLELDPRSARLTSGGREIRLLPKELALMEFFMRHPNQLFSPDTLLDRVWTSESDVSRDLVKVYINRLRSKIDAPGAQSLIRNVHGLGYILQLSAPERADEVAPG